MISDHKCSTLQQSVHWLSSWCYRLDSSLRRDRNTVVENWPSFITRTPSLFVVSSSSSCVWGRGLSYGQTCKQIKNVILDNKDLGKLSLWKPLFFTFLGPPSHPQPLIFPKLRWFIYKWDQVDVSLYLLSMKSPAKSSLADIANERFEPEVFPLMPGQLVWSGKPAVAVSPGTLEWLLSRVGPRMGLTGAEIS